MLLTLEAAAELCASLTCRATAMVRVCVEVGMLTPLLATLRGPGGMVVLIEYVGPDDVRILFTRPGAGAVRAQETAQLTVFQRDGGATTFGLDLAFEDLIADPPPPRPAAN